MKTRLRVDNFVRLFLLLAMLAAAALPLGSVSAHPLPAAPVDALTNAALTPPAVPPPPPVVDEPAVPPQPQRLAAEPGEWDPGLPAGLSRDPLMNDRHQPEAELPPHQRPPERPDGPQRPAEKPALHGVVYPAAGQPSEPVRVTLSLPGGTQLTTTTTLGGQFAFDQLPVNGPARYQLEFAGQHGEPLAVLNEQNTQGMVGEGNNPAVQQFWLAEEDSPRSDAPKFSASTAMLAPGEGEIRGRVTGADTQLPLENALVYLYDQAWYYINAMNTNVDGEYAFTALADGSYFVQVYAPEVSMPDGSMRRMNYLDAYYDGVIATEQASSITISDGAVVSGIDLALEPGGKISGRVTSAEDGSPLAGVSVSASATTIYYYTTVVTDNEGYYTIDRLINAPFRVSFSMDSSSGSDYLSEFYDNKTYYDADFVQVTAGQEAGNINAALALGGSISGQVTSEATGQLQNANLVVTATTPNGDYFQSYVDAEGYYTIHGLPAGDYAVRFYDYNGTYAPEFYNNKVDDQQADRVTVAPRQAVVDINAALSPAGTISGTVIGADTGLPVGNISVCGRLIGSTFSTCYTTGAGGEYFLTGLMPGQYRVQFTPMYDSDYLSEYYDNSRQEAGSAPVAVSIGEVVTHIDANLEVGGVITGVVTAGDTGDPLPNVGINLIQDQMTVRYATTDNNGQYRLSGIAPGNYTLQFDPSYCMGSPCPGLSYRVEYYDNKADSNTADQIQVVENSTQTINAALDRTTSISGVVRDAVTGQPLYNASINFYLSRNYEYAGYAQTNAAGEYTLVVPNNNATYYIYATATNICDPVSLMCGPANYVGQYYQGKYSIETADGVTVAPQTSTTGIDFALQMGGKISGRVVDGTTGNPVAGAIVIATPVGGSMGYSAATDDNGDYTIFGLLDGGYTVKFESPNVCDENWNCVYPYSSHYYDNKPNESQADVVTVAAGGETTGINAALSKAKYITGRVTSEATGQGLEGVYVSVYDPSGAMMGSGYSNAQGYYKAGPLAQGDYRVWYWTQWDNMPQVLRDHMPEFYNNKPSMELADLVHVGGSADTTGIDASLAVGAKISGKVSAEDSGAWLGDVQVVLRDPDQDIYKTVNTNSQGNYVFSGLVPGSYYLQFVTNSSANSVTQNYAGEYYKDKLIYSQADRLKLTTGQAMTGIDAKLARGGAIAGKVTAADTKAALSGISINVFRTVDGNSSTYLGYAVTDNDGNYRAYGLPAGQYEVRFYPGGGVDYVSAAYNNRDRFSAGDLVTVTAGSTTSGINAALEPGVHISGRVTSEADGLGLSNVHVTLIDSQGRSSGSAWTDSGGYYTTPAVEPGDYRVDYSPYYWADERTISHVREYYNDKDSYDQADLLHLELGASRTDMDVSLRLGGKISGRVTAQDTGEGLPNVEVYAITEDGYNSSRSVYTAADGSYVILGLRGANHYVRFVTRYVESGPAIDYVGEYYDGVTSTEFATPVPVSLGQVTSSIDASLVRGGRITGLVRADDGGRPLPDVDVYIFDEQGYQVGFAYSNVAGVYTSEALREGSYRLMFYPYDMGSSADYSEEAYNNRAWLEDGDLVTVTTANSTTANISLARGGTISGQVRAAGSMQTLGDVRVTAYPTGSTGGFFTKNSYTSADGAYAIKGLRPGTYKVRFESLYNPQYAQEWYNNRWTYDTAAEITVTAGGKVTGINAALDVGGKITGQVTDAETGQPVSGAFISVSRQDIYAYAESGPDGRYELMGLPTGEYVLQTGGADYASEYYNNAHTDEAITPVQVTLGATTTGINMALEKGGWITGRVTAAADGRPLYAQVALIDSAGNWLTVYANQGGGYGASVLPGSYHVYFFEGHDYYTAESYLPQYYSAASSLENAQLVTVAAGQMVSGIDAALQTGGSIAGRVTNAAGQPLDGVQVQALNSAGEVVGMGYTNADGYYQTVSLPAGSFRLFFNPLEGRPSAAYLPEYYQDQPDLASAGVVTVTENEVTGDIDAVLQPVMAGFSAAARTVSEAAGQVTLTLALSQQSPRSVVVPFRVSGWATGSVDHTLLDGQFMFAPGETTSSLNFQVINDTLTESDETIVVRLGQPANALLGSSPVHTITITDNDPAPVNLPAPALTALAPVQGRQDLTGEISISGSNFVAGSVASLQLGGSSTPLSTRFASAGQLTATIPADLPLGKYNLVVTNPDGKQASLSSVYTILPPLTDDLFANSYDLWTDPATIFSGQAVSLGLVVSRQGGTSTLSDLPVRFYLGNPASGGTLIGASSVGSMPPHGSASTGSVTWTPAAAGSYTIYAVIDPDASVAETVESNNTIMRTVAVNNQKTAPPDRIPPVVDSFTVNGGATITTAPQVKLAVKASDPTPGDAVKQVIFYEYNFDSSTRQWIQTQASDWQAYSTAQFDWTLTATAGAKYLQAWVADKAGNISEAPLSSYINYVPTDDTLARGQSRYYVFNLDSGEIFNSLVTPQAGDADLYVWAPDFQFREPWSSIASGGADQVMFAAPVTGMYVVQVYGYSGSTYHLAMEVGGGSPAGFAQQAAPLAAAVMPGDAKEPLSEPQLQPGAAPSEQRAVTAAVPAPEGEVLLFLPFTRR